MRLSRRSVMWRVASRANPQSIALQKRLHPRLAQWFRRSYGNFTEAQLLCVPAILEHQSILLTSPTGSGKTFAGFLGVFDSLLRKLDARELHAGVQCIYVSPLRALAYDIEKNLKGPIAGMGLEKELRVHSRTGDTTAAQRASFKRRGAHVLVTTPESLAVMLAQEAYRVQLRTTEFVIVDELHSFAGNKRGADLSVSLERLQQLCGEREICRVGLSATAAPVELLAQFLVGVGRACRIAEAKLEKEPIVEVFSPIRRKPYPPAGYTGARLYEELAQLIRSRKSVIVFTNVRSAAEQLGLKLKELLPDLAKQIETHHASLDRSVRMEVEDRLKDGELRAVACSTSLELGIDIGAVDLVVMVATPKGVSRAIQRIGRSGHSLNKNSHGILVATNINDLVEATVTARLVRQRVLDPIRIQEQPVDVIAQHVVGMAATVARVSNLRTAEAGKLETCATISADEMFAIIRRAFPFRELSRAEFDEILNYLEGGGSSLAAQYRGLFGKITVDENGLVSLAHPRIAREFLVNIGTIVSESFVDVFMRRRRL
ncbi:MAG TPA: DEAD/DEAH box helicase, partial [Chthoniobacterales bacterium]|nr:DEAD/DEAH box helicase [Chthoniobacterales bacterium]